MNWLPLAMISLSCTLWRFMAQSQMATAKPSPPQQVHPQRTEAVVHGFLRAGIADQDKGNHAGDLPEKVDPDQIETTGRDQTSRP